MFIGTTTKAQRMHLELGAHLGFKDEFFQHPEFSLSAAYAEFHIYELSAFSRVSKRRLGGELDVGFEKAANYFIRFDGESTSNAYFNLNRLKNGLYIQYYLLKSSTHKWDIQLGATQYFNLSPMYLSDSIGIKRWKLAGRAGVNYTFKSVILGIYYEHTLRNDYNFSQPNAIFGFRLGLIY